MSIRAGMPFGDSQGSLIERAIFHGRHAALEASEPSFNELERKFGPLLREALRKRLMPNTALHPKQLAHAIGVSERAVHKILAGDSDGQAGTVASIVWFFWSLGDRALVHELYALPPLGVVAELKRPLIEARAMLDQALGQEVA